jgi:hypothetical protein
LESSLPQGAALAPEPVPELMLALAPELDPQWELEWESAPTTSHIAQPCQPKLPGISSLFLLEM